MSMMSRASECSIVTLRPSGEMGVRLRRREHSWTVCLSGVLNGAQEEGQGQAEAPACKLQEKVGVREIGACAHSSDLDGPWSG